MWLPAVADRPFAGVELGGTKCVCTLALGPDDIIDQQVVATTTPDATLGGLAAVLTRWQSEHEVRSLGIASFGPVDLDRLSPTFGKITTTTKPIWQMADVAGRLGACIDGPLALDTDVNGAALAETRWGAGRGMADFAYITVGTGVGVGLIANGQPVHGFGHPELGHIRVARMAGDDWPGACPFHGGCVEGLASGSALQARLGARSPADLASDDPIWESVAFTLAQLCHSLVCSTAPARIAIGGGVIDKQPHLLGRIEPLLVKSLAGYIPLPGGCPYIVAPGLGTRAGPLGSIALAMDAVR